jgi:hypothetical protein
MFITDNLRLYFLGTVLSLFYSLAVLYSLSLVNYWGGDLHVLERAAVIKAYCHVFIARGNNKRGFSRFNKGVYLNSYRDYTQQIQHTLSRSIAQKCESSSNALVDSVLVIPGYSLVPCAPESWSSTDFTGRLLNHNYFTSLYFTQDSSSGTKLLKTETELVWCFTSVALYNLHADCTETQLYCLLAPTAHKTSHIVLIVACRLTATEMCSPLRCIATFATRTL